MTLTKAHGRIAKMGIAAACCCGLVALLYVALTDTTHDTSKRGTVDVIDNGLRAFPRYTCSVGVISSSSPEVSASIVVPTNIKMTFRMWINHKNTDVKEYTPPVDFTLITESGMTIVSSFTSEGSWHLMDRGNGGSAWWHDEWVMTSMRGNEVYRCHISVKPGSTLPDDLEYLIELYGGGIELP